MSFKVSIKFVPLLLLGLLIMSLSNCNKEKTNPTLVAGNLQLNFNHFFKTDTLKFTPITFITKANDTLKLTDLMYYISNITLTKSDGSTWNSHNYALVNAQSPEAINIANVPAGDYTKISFLLGVDSVNNHTLNHNETALDPSRGMAWSWLTGYIFFRIKGYFNNHLGMSFDIGGDQNLLTMNYSLTNFHVENNTKTLDFKVDVNKMFEDPNTYDLKTQVTSIHTPNDPEIALFNANISNGMYTLTSVK